MSDITPNNQQAPLSKKETDGKKRQVYCLDALPAKHIAVIEAATYPSVEEINAAGL